MQSNWLCPKRRRREDRAQSPEQHVPTTWKPGSVTWYVSGAPELAQQIILSHSTSWLSVRTQVLIDVT